MKLTSLIDILKALAIPGAVLHHAPLASGPFQWYWLKEGPDGEMLATKEANIHALPARDPRNAMEKGLIGEIRRRKAQIGSDPAATVQITYTLSDEGREYLLENGVTEEPVPATLTARPRESKMDKINRLRRISNTRDR